MTITTINPYTLEPLAHYEEEEFNQVTVKIEKARSAFNKWRQADVAERVLILQEALQYFDKNREVIAKDICEQMGRPLHQCDGEIKGLFERAEYLLSIAEDTLQPDALGERNGCDRNILHEPLGVVFVISAWNYPLLITINGVMTSLLAGNTVILKHAAQTVSIGRHFAAAFGQIPEFKDLLQDIIVDHDVAGKVISKGDIDHLIFTGSDGGGHAVYQKAATRFIDCNLELGGKDGAYVAADADVKAAAESLVDGAMFNAGQSCCGIERVYVHETLYEAFVARCKELIDKYVLGDPKNPSTSMGPLNTADSASTMQAQILDALSKGAKIERGGESIIIGAGTFFQPTLVTNVNHKMQMMIEENFGPIMPVMMVTSDKQAVDLINDSGYGLTAAIFTQSLEHAREFSKEVNTGTVFMNRCDYLDPALPWTGVNDSGKGSALSKYGFYSVTRCKALNFKN